MVLPFLRHAIDVDGKSLPRRLVLAWQRQAEHAQCGHDGGSVAVEPLGDLRDGQIVAGEAADGLGEVKVDHGRSASATN